MLGWIFMMSFAYQELSLIEFEGTVISGASSMAAIILQVCKIRKCARHAGVLIHHIYRRNISLDVLNDDDKLKTLKEDMQKTQQRLYDILTTRTGKTLEEIRDECKKDKMMQAEEALAFGLIDEII